MNKIFLKKYSWEFLGTFILAFATLTTGNPLAIGLMFATLIIIGKNISGGHYNPAITLAHWLRGNFSASQIPGYMISQTIGAFAAGALYCSIFGKIAYPAPVASLGTLKPMFIEMLGTFILCMTVLKVSAIEKIDTTLLGGLIVGLSLAAAIFMGGAFSGGAFNPAFGTGTILFDVVKGGASHSFLLIYLIGPFAGGLLANLVLHCTDAQ